MIRVDFTVYGSTLEQLLDERDEKLALFAPGREWTKIDIDIRPMTMSVSNEVLFWKGEVGAVS